MDGTIRLSSHKSTSFHKEAMQDVLELLKQCADIGEMMSKQHSDNKKKTENAY